MAEEQQDVETLKRRGRRRLVGAVALVLAAVVILPMVFDPEPKSTQTPVTVKIPAENEAPPFAPKAAPKAAPSAAPKEEAKEPPKEPARPEPAAPVAQTPGGDYVIQVGAFTKPEAVRAKLSAAKVPYYTEPMSGNLTRVLAGPFKSREAAERALGKLRELGLKPGQVTPKSG
ncbi:MAG TPA: SPOR domain-containing protein [Burkholderiales bacterium]|jgi:DedD protein|nr:SPOR domain-containing protein [Burkholderiales bacterium]